MYNFRVLNVKCIKNCPVIVTVVIIVFYIHVMYQGWKGMEYIVRGHQVKELFDAETHRLHFDTMGWFGLDIPLLTSHSDHSLLYPNKTEPWKDRVMLQLAYVPPAKPTRNMTIMISHIWDVNVKEGRQTLLDLKCKVTECLLTWYTKDALTADLVLLLNSVDHSKRVLRVLNSKPRRPEQIWMFYNHESWLRSENVCKNLVFNWTATYKPSSTVPDLTDYLLPKVNGVEIRPQKKNYANGKTGKVIWIVSNCHTPNERMTYVKELSKYIQVDIYGWCGNRSICPRSKFPRECKVKLLAKYKFYLSFENSNCETYVTEKFFTTDLMNVFINRTKYG